MALPDGAVTADIQLIYKEVTRQFI